MTNSDPGAAIVSYAETADLDLDALASLWLPRLDGAIRDRFEALRFARDRRDLLAAHVLLEMHRTPDTQRWTLTHTDGFVAVALVTDDGVRVGVDAEPSAAIERLETMREVVMSSADAPEIGLVELWTIKEAYLKSIGEGFSTARGFGVLQLIECTPGDRLDDWWTIAIRDARAGVRARAWTVHVGEHVLSVVAGGAEGPAPLLQRVTLA